MEGNGDIYVREEAFRGTFSIAGYRTTVQCDSCGQVWYAFRRDATPPEPRMCLKCISGTTRRIE